MQTLALFSVDVCTKCNIGILFPTSACGDPIIPVPLVEVAALFLVNNNFNSFVKDCLNVDTWIAFWGFHCSTSLYFIAVPSYFEYYCCAMCPEVWESMATSYSIILDLSIIHLLILTLKLVCYISVNYCSTS